MAISNKDIVSKLIEKKVISNDQLSIAMKEYERLKGTKNIGSILVEMGFVSDGVIGEVLNETSGVKVINIRTTIIDTKLTKRVPKDFAIHHKLIPISYNSEAVTVAMSDVFDIVAIDQVKHFFPSSLKISPVYAVEADIIQAIDQYYDHEMSIEGIIKELESGGAKIDINDESKLRDDYKSPMVRLVDAILSDAVHRGASDLHFEPESGFLRIRYRIDGKMMQVRSIHREYYSAIVVRIKILSGMNIAENRKSQDGRINTEILGSKIDFRVASQPTIHGENIVMRVLNERNSIVSLDKIGFSERNISLIKRMTQRPEGVIVLTGPTGSGKTTTLYATLSYINSIEKNIMTLEDPVEYQIPLIRQCNIRHDIGIDFASGIKSLLRQDPDVILVGEVRDKETAITAIQAAMTGHQVYTSLHTNDAISAIPRLMNMGVPTYLMAGSLIGIVAQRLVRKLCNQCKAESPLDTAEQRLLGPNHSKVKKIFKAVGCSSCYGGYKDRTVVCEILVFDKELDDLVSSGASRKEILAYALDHGFIPMVEDGLLKVVEGVTDLKELMRVVDLTDRLS